MEDQLITFETAKLAKEKGFDWDCRYAYDNDEYFDPGIDWKGEEFFTNYDIINASNNGYNAYLAPTQSLLQRWLRECKDIIVTIDYNYTKEGMKCKYTYEIKNSCPIKIIFGEYYGKYEQALEIALFEALNLIR